MEQALAIRRSPENLFSLAQSLAYPGGGRKGTREQKSRAYELIQEAKRSPQQHNDPDFLVLQAQLAMASADAQNRPCRVTSKPAI